METDELKIGDLVFYNNPVTNEKELAYVMGVAYYENHVMVAPLSAKMLPVYDNEISGVPLTKEIMEKNFDYCSVNEYSHERAGLDFKLIYRNKINETHIIDDIEVYKRYYADIEGETGPYLTSVTYVHELQHLLWALGWKDNIKL